MKSLRSILNEKETKTKVIGQQQSQRSKHKKMDRNDLSIAFHMRKQGKSNEEIAAYFDLPTDKMNGELYAAKDWHPDYTATSKKKKG